MAKKKKSAKADTELKNIPVPKGEGEMTSTPDEKVVEKKAVAKPASKKGLPYKAIM